MKVTKVSIKRIESKSTTHFKATAEIVLDDELRLSDLRIVDGTGGLFVVYPPDPSRKGDLFYSIFLPLSKDLRDHIATECLKAYEENLKEASK